MTERKFFKGTVISQKQKVNRWGKPYVGVVVKIDETLRVWFATDWTLRGPHGESVGFEVEGTADEGSTSDDGQMTFLRKAEVEVVQPKAGPLGTNSPVWMGADAPVGDPWEQGLQPVKPSGAYGVAYDYRQRSESAAPGDTEGQI